MNFNDDLFKQIISLFTNEPETIENVDNTYSEYSNLFGGTKLRPYLSVKNFEEELTTRHQLFAISLYELVKYDKPTNYLNMREEKQPSSYRPKFPKLYDKYTYEFRDIVLNYYPRDFYGFKLTDRMLKVGPKHTEKFWDLGNSVYEWVNVPPMETNNIPRNINLPTF